MGVIVGLQDGVRVRFGVARVGVTIRFRVRVVVGVKVRIEVGFWAMVGIGLRLNLVFEFGAILGVKVRNEFRAGVETGFRVKFQIGT